MPLHPEPCCKHPRTVPHVHCQDRGDTCAHCLACRGVHVTGPPREICHVEQRTGYCRACRLDAVRSLARRLGARVDLQDDAEVLQEKIRRAVWLTIEPVYR